MGDPRQVPPTPGTTPRVSEHAERPYRENADIYARHREQGTHPYTDDEVEARIVANAADAATEAGSGSLDVPFLRELVSVFRHRLYRDLPLDPGQRVRRSRELLRAESQRATAEGRRRDCGRRRRELESARQRMPRPVGGSKFTHPAWLAAGLVPAGVIEFLGSVAALEAAFKLDWLPAALFAVSIATILIVAADQFGIALASITRDARSRAVGITALLVIVAVGCGIWAIATLAQSRAANTAYKAAGERQAESGGAGIQAGQGGGSAGEGLKSVEAAAEERRTGSAEPDIGFFVPLSILVLATATLLAFRVEAASDWNGLDEELGEVIGQETDAREQEERARTEAQEDITTEDESVNELAVYVERQHALLVVWLERFQAEYRRFCGLEKREPRDLRLPDVPEAGDVLADLLDADPGRPPPRSRPPHSAAPNSSRRGPAEGPGPGPGQGSAPDGGSPGGEPEPPPPRPHSSRGRKRQPDGRPAGS